MKSNLFLYKRDFYTLFVHQDLYKKKGLERGRVSTRRECKEALTFADTREDSVFSKSLGSKKEKWAFDFLHTLNENLKGSMRNLNPETIIIASTISAVNLIFLSLKKKKNFFSGNDKIIPWKIKTKEGKLHCVPKIHGILDGLCLKGSFAPYLEDLHDNANWAKVWDKLHQIPFWMLFVEGNL